MKISEIFLIFFLSFQNLAFKNFPPPKICKICPPQAVVRLPPSTGTGLVSRPQQLQVRTYNKHRQRGRTCGAFAFVNCIGGGGVRYRFYRFALSKIRENKRVHTSITPAARSPASRSNYFTDRRLQKTTSHEYLLR